MKLIMMTCQTKAKNGHFKWYCNLKIECKFTALLKLTLNKGLHLMPIEIFNNF